MLFWLLSKTILDACTIQYILVFIFNKMLEIFLSLIEDQTQFAYSDKNILKLIIGKNGNRKFGVCVCVTAPSQIFEFVIHLVHFRKIAAMKFQKVRTDTFLLKITVIV